MTKYELLTEINFFASTADPQSEMNLETLYMHYCDMFLTYCGELPNFEIVDSKGTVELK